MPDALDPPVDEVSAPWWDATRSRRLVIQHCVQCGHWQHYPRTVCTSCGATDPPFCEVAGSGVVDTWTEVWRAPDVDRTVPYVVARIRLTEGPVLLTVLVAADGSSRVQDPIDLPVTVDWSPLADGRHLPVFRLVSKSSPPMSPTTEGEPDGFRPDQ
jgi:uncharacterized OB-fold protein